MLRRVVLRAGKSVVQARDSLDADVLRSRHERRHLDGERVVEREQDRLAVGAVLGLASRSAAH